MSSRPCGCDPEANHICELHTAVDVLIEGAKAVADSPFALIGDARPFVVKDSGARQQFDSGMVRDVTTDKIDYSLVFDGPMLERLAIHLTKGAQKYDARNWMKAAGPTEQDRFRQSAVRHFIQWLRGDTDEDHAAAVYFNINGVEYVKERTHARP